MDKYVDSKIWLVVPGGVEGWTVEELNNRIDEWNAPHNKAIRSLGTFFGWLSYMEGRKINGFSILYQSCLTVQLHIIKD